MVITLFLVKSYERSFFIKIYRKITQISPEKISVLRSTSITKKPPPGGNQT